ncbi:MAG: hypothetical protein RJB38_1960 [Pseudomonadota bacterium]
MKIGFSAGFVEYWARVGRSLSSLWKAILASSAYLGVRNESHKELTEQYPDLVSARSADELPPRTRGQLFNDIDRCTGCGDCVTACPTDCIEVEAEEGPQPGKRWVSVFKIDHSKCLFCGFCVESCAPQSLTHTKTHRTASRTLNEQVLSFGRGQASQSLRELWRNQNGDMSPLEEGP